MNFFKELTELLQGVQVTLTIKEKNGKVSVSVLPDSVDKVQPLVVTATAEELDSKFIDAIRKPIAAVQEVIVHNEAYEKSLEDAKKKAAEKKTEEKGKSADKKIAKKKTAEPKKAAPEKKAPVQEVKPEGAQQLSFIN